MKKKKKNIGADNHRSDDTGSIFYHLSSVIFHCIYRNKINCRTNYTACKSAVEFLCTDTCGITGLYHCVWTIFLWICLCIWNLGGFRLFYFIYDSQKKKKETVEMFFKSGKDTPVFKICCPACCPASLHKRLQQCRCCTQSVQCIFPFPSVEDGRQPYRNRSLFIGYSRNGIGTKIFLSFLMPNGSSIFPDAGVTIFCNQTKQRKLYSKL